MAYAGFAHAATCLRSAATRASVTDDPASAGPADPSGGPRVPGRRAKRGRKHTVAKVVVTSGVILALVTGLTVIYLYRQLNANLTGVDVEGLLEDRPDPVEVEGPKEPLNVLVMGSDTRDGEGNDIDGLTGDGARSDTTIFFHFSADRDRAYGVSIPRDSMVDRPACHAGEIPAQDYVQWNEAFTLGGQACTIQQFEQLTDIRVDNYVVLDFAGFREMVDAIDGVKVCIPETIDDREHGIYLEAGTREVEGKEALNYVRQRYAVGDGSDIGRMKRQQAFIASMANKVVSAGTLSRPDRIYGFLSAATKSLTVDPELDNIRRLAGLGLEFQGIGLDNIQFVTVPFAQDPRDPNRLVWTSEADRVWQLLREDRVLPGSLTDGAISAAGTPGSSPLGDESSGGGSGSGGGGGGPSEEERERAEAAGLCA